MSCRCLNVSRRQVYVSQSMSSHVAPAVCLLYAEDDIVIAMTTRSLKTHSRDVR